MDVNDYLDDPPTRRVQPVRSTRRTPRDDREAEYRQPVVTQEIHDRRSMNDNVRRARQEFVDEDDFIYDEPRQPAEQKRRSFFGRKPQRQPVQTVEKKLHSIRELIQCVFMFVLAMAIIGVSAWQAWTVEGINESALSIKWIHVSQAILALQVLILFFVVDLKKSS